MKMSFLILLITSIVPFAAFSAEISSTIDNQKDVSVTVYNSNLGLIKDLRNINLPKGQLELKFMDVAALIKPNTVLVKSMNSPNAIEILEQNYEYDLLNPNKLLDKFIGKELKVVFRNNLKDSEKEVLATLLSKEEGYVFKIGDQIRIDNPDAWIVPRIPDNLISKPTLIWTLENSSSKSHDIEATYLTDGINWNADYVALLDKNDALCDLSGWVTIDNRSGATYKNAKLKLVAGDVNRVYDAQPMMEMALGEPSSRKAKAQFAEEGLFEYHMYSLDRRTTVKNNETKQISLLNVPNIPVKKEFLYFGMDSYFRSSYRDLIDNQKVSTYVEINNSKNNNLGIPLPKGVIRAYKKDSEGSIQFIGEDSIDHTPKDEKIKIKLGDAFDVLAQRKQTDYQALGDRKYSMSWTITIKNHKDEDITVGIIEPVWADWDIKDTTRKYAKIDARRIRFDLNVPKNGKVDVSYKVVVKW